MEKWEYLTKMASLDTHLDEHQNITRIELKADWNLPELGEQGWELVGILPVTDSGGATSFIQYIFKRPKE